MRFGLDYVGTLSPAAHKAVGSTFACRYLRELGAGEVRELHAGGIDVVLIHEHAAKAALGGRAQGVRDAHEALGQANALGAPSTVPIYFTVDFDETPTQAAPVAEYLKGVASVIGIHRTGGYGGYWTITRLFHARLITWGWQTYAWSGTNLPPGDDKQAQLFQFSNSHTVAGHGVDFNHSLVENFGQWSARPVPAPKPKPKPVPPNRFPHIPSRLKPLRRQAYNLGWQDGNAWKGQRP